MNDLNNEVAEANELVPSQPGNADERNKRFADQFVKQQAKEGEVKFVQTEADVGTA